MDLLPCIVSHSPKSTDCKVLCMTSTLARSRHSFEVNLSKEQCVNIQKGRNQRTGDIPYSEP